jgi:hypothetical protein
MRDTLEAAKANGGELHRWPGGFWMTEPVKPGIPRPTAIYFRSLSVAALVRRGLATVHWGAMRLTT